MKSYVLITGSTSGIGYELARIFAANGYALILVGRDEQKINRVKKEMSQSGKDMITLCVDLSQPNSGKWLFEETKRLDLKVDILVNNAGVGYVGEFVEASDEKIMELITLNMTNLTILTKAFAQEMMKEGKGKILNVASTGAYHPGPYTAVYYATKAYVLSLSEALAEELKPYGVCVSSLCPGATATHFAEAAGRQDAQFAMKSDFVAQKAYKGLMKQQTLIIPGLQNWLFVKIPRIFAKKMIKAYQKRYKK